MAFKFNEFSYDSSSGAQPQPPFGSPTGHAGDQVDNISREALSAINGLGQGVFGLTLNGAAHNPGDQPQIQQVTGPGPGDVNQLSGPFAQIIYDLIFRPGLSCLSLYTDGMTEEEVNNALVPAGVTATWRPCDGTNTPDLRGAVLYGGDPGNATPVNTGDAVAENAAESGTGLTTTDGADAANVVGHGHGDTLAFSLPNHIHGTGDGTNFVTSGANYFQGDAGNAVQHQDKTHTGNPTTLPACTKSGGVTAVASDSNPHSHPITDVNHSHAGQLPAGKALEVWMRVT